MKDAIRDGLRAVSNTLLDGTVVRGAGAFEVGVPLSIMPFYAPDMMHIVWAISFIVKLDSQQCSSGHEGISRNTLVVYTDWWQIGFSGCHFMHYVACRWLPHTTYRRSPGKRWKAEPSSASQHLQRLCWASPRSWPRTRATTPRCAASVLRRDRHSQCCAASRLTQQHSLMGPLSAGRALAYQCKGHPSAEDLIRPISPQNAMQCARHALPASFLLVQSEAHDLMAIVAGHLQDTIIALDEEVARGNKVGLDVATGEPMDPALAGVYDNLSVKRQMLQSAPVVASQLLLVDEVIRAHIRMKQ